MAAMAQWQWLDKDGRKVFSDRAAAAGHPGEEHPEAPGWQPHARAVSPPRTAPAAASAPRAAAPPQPAAPRPSPSGKDKELEEKKKQAEQAEAAKSKAEEDRSSRRHGLKTALAPQQAKAGFDSGARIATTNKAGERVILDDDARAAETKRLQGVIQSECN